MWPQEGFLMHGEACLTNMAFCCTEICKHNVVVLVCVKLMVIQPMNRKHAVLFQMLSMTLLRFLVRYHLYCLATSVLLVQGL